MNRDELINHLPCIVFTAHVATGRLRFTHVGGAGLSRLAPDTSDGDGLLTKAIHPDDLPKFTQTDSADGLVRLQDVNGEWQHCFLHRGDTVADGDGDHYAGMLTDASGQQSLADDAQRYRDYAEMSSDWYWEQDEEFRFTYFSREFEEVTGVPSSQGLGKTRWHGLGKERLSNIDWAAHEQSLREHQPFRNLEYPARRQDGKIVWFRRRPPVFSSTRL